MGSLGRAILISWDTGLEFAVPSGEGTRGDELRAYLDKNGEGPFALSSASQISSPRPSARRNLGGPLATTFWEVKRPIDPGPRSPGSVNNSSGRS